MARHVSVVACALLLVACSSHHEPSYLADGGTPVDATVVPDAPPVDAMPDAGPPPDPLGGCERDGDTVTGHAITPVGELEGRQAWLWTYRAWGPPRPTVLVITSERSVGEDPMEREGALVHEGNRPVPGQLVARITEHEDESIAVSVSFVGPSGEIVTALGATLTLEGDDFAPGLPVRGRLTLSTAGWDVDLAFDFLKCGHLTETCLC